MVGSIGVQPERVQSTGNWIWERVTDHGSAKKYGRERAQKSQSSYSI